MSARTQAPALDTIAECDDWEERTNRANQTIQAGMLAVPRADINVQVFNTRSRSGSGSSGTSRGTNQREVPIQIHYSRVSYPFILILILQKVVVC